jgi:hypothetical protein
MGKLATASISNPYFTVAIFVALNSLKHKKCFKINKSELAVSRVLSRAIIHLGQQSLTGSSNTPDPKRGPRHMRSYLVLLRVEFTLPHTVASGAVRSYRTLSPLPIGYE